MLYNRQPRNWTNNIKAVHLCFFFSFTFFFNEGSDDKLESLINLTADKDN